jgi:hypothetical protein
MITQTQLDQLRAAKESSFYGGTYLDRITGQARRWRYPGALTCRSGNRRDTAHRAYQAGHPDDDFGELIPTLEGWKCPVCDYFQPYDMEIFPQVKPRDLNPLPK